MAQVVVLGNEVRHRFIFELRYERGELYWDRCGRVARTLAGQKGWGMQSVDGNGCHIRNDDLNLAFNYSPTKLDLSQSQNSDVASLLPTGEFANIAEEFSETVVRAFDLDFFPRIGFRVWTMYGTESMEDASARIDRMSFFSSSKSLLNLGKPSHVSHSVVIARPTCMVRVAATPFEQQVPLAPSIVAAARKEGYKHSADQRRVRLQQMKAQKIIKAYPAFGVLIDLDAYIEEPPYPDQVSVRGFIDGAENDFRQICDTILSEGKQQ